MHRIIQSEVENRKKILDKEDQCQTIRLDMFKKGKKNKS